MTTAPENLQSSESKSPTPSPNSAITSAASELQNPFQGLGAEDAWRRLRAKPRNVVSQEEMMQRVQEQARRPK